jgi:hypothetical protein
MQKKSEKLNVPEILFGSKACRELKLLKSNWKQFLMLRRELKLLGAVGDEVVRLAV